MLIIGLVGAGEDRRDKVTAGLITAGQSTIAAYSQCGFSAPLARKKRLCEVIRTAQQDRGSSTALVISHVLTLDEADVIRGAGGVLWHVEGRPSGEIPIQPFDDLMVTWRERDTRHYLDPLEALSESRLRLQAPSKRVAV